MYMHPPRVARARRTPAVANLVSVLFATSPSCVAAVTLSPAGGPAVASGAAGGRTHPGGHALQLGSPTMSEDMTEILHVLDTFKGYALEGLMATGVRHQADKAWFQEGVQLAQTDRERRALSRSIEIKKQSLADTTRIYNNMISFSSSLQSVLQTATSKGYGCEQLDCGVHASCTDSVAGAICICNEGFIGPPGRDGQGCHAPPEFAVHRLRVDATSGAEATLADIDVTVFGVSKLAVAYRDVTHGNIGKLLVGLLREAGMVDASLPEQFTTPGGKAFSPVVAGTPGGRLAVAWRDEKRKGTCWLRGAAVRGIFVRGTAVVLNWGSSVPFCADQAHKMSLLSFQSGRFVVFFPDRAKATAHTPAESFGNSLVADVGHAGALDVGGRFRFSDYPVCRLSATKLTPSAFVLAARAGKAVDGMDPARTTRQEAMGVYGELVDSNLVFDPNSVSIEPSGTQIWARDVSLIAPSTVAYAYQAGPSRKVQVAVVEIDPGSHSMKVAQRPVVIHSGVSSYVSMLSVPYAPSSPHSLVYYESDNASMVSLCSWAPEKKALERCQELEWLGEKLASVSGVHLGGGKTLMAFARHSGGLHYVVFGLSKK